MALPLILFVVGLRCRLPIHKTFKRLPQTRQCLHQALGGPRLPYDQRSSSGPYGEEAQYGFGQVTACLQTSVISRWGRERASLFLSCLSSL